MPLGTLATVTSSQELFDAIADPDISKITLGNDLVVSSALTVSNLVNLDLEQYTLTADLFYDSQDSGELTISGMGSLIGSLTVDTPNATVNNGISVTGNILWYDDQSPLQMSLALHKTFYHSLLSWLALGDFDK